MAANQKLGFADASKSEVNTVALPQTTAPVRRCFQERAANELNRKIEINTDQKRGDAFRSKLRFNPNSITGEKINRGAGQAECIMKGRID